MKNKFELEKELVTSFPNITYIGIKEGTIAATKVEFTFDNERYTRVVSLFFEGVTLFDDSKRGIKQIIETFVRIIHYHAYPMEGDEKTGII